MSKQSFYLLLLFFWTLSACQQVQEVDLDQFDDEQSATTRLADETEVDIRLVGNIEGWDTEKLRLYYVDAEDKELDRYNYYTPVMIGDTQEKSGIWMSTPNRAAYAVWHANAYRGEDESILIRLIVGDNYFHLPMEEPESVLPARGLLDRYQNVMGRIVVADTRIGVPVRAVMHCNAIALSEHLILSNSHCWHDNENLQHFFFARSGEQKVISEMVFEDRLYDQSIYRLEESLEAEYSYPRLADRSERLAIGRSLTLLSDLRRYEKREVAGWTHDRGELTESHTFVSEFRMSHFIAGQPHIELEVLNNGELRLSIYEISELRGPNLRLHERVARGQSGSPVFNTDGRLIGVLYAQARPRNNGVMSLLSERVIEFVRDYDAEDA